MFKEFPDVVDVKTLGRMLGISVKSAYRLLESNQIRHKKIGRIYRIPKNAVISYLNEK